jgi:hypothetical protein
MYDEYIALLKSSVCKVTFTKVNGEVRNMRCTLVRDMIPQGSTPKVFDDEKVESTSSNEVIRVYDLTAQGWRSFKVANVTEFTVE